MRRAIIAAVLALAAGCTPAESPIVIGAVYPTGTHGMGGADELRGVRMAVEWANARGGIGGRPVRLVSVPADSADAAPAAVREVVAGGASVILGSYGSTISAPAAVTAADLDAVFWETGAVGEMPAGVRPGDRFFRVVSEGGGLGSAGVSFVRDRLARRLDADGPLRYAVAYVDDVYGRAVGLGAAREVRASGLRLAGTFPYDLTGFRPGRLARRIARSGADVLVVAAYLEDGIALRRAVVRRGVPLAASVGTSSSYCMPAFGKALGRHAVGLFASDKPDGDMLDPGDLAPEAADALRWARELHDRRHDHEMHAATLSGFASAWALFRHVLPAAETLSPDAVAAAANGLRLRAGSLPNGSGLRFGPPGSSAAGENLEAVSVIWEWVRPNTREIVWPRFLATSPVVVRPI